MKLVELTYCLCGELMKKVEVKNNEIPVCWKCRCNSEEELNSKLNKKKHKTNKNSSKEEKSNS